MEALAWLKEQTREHLASVLGGMVGQEPAVYLREGDAGPSTGLIWRQLFENNAETSLWVQVSDQTQRLIGEQVLGEGSPEEELRSTLVEILGQLGSSVGRSLSQRCGREILLGESGIQAEWPVSLGGHVMEATLAADTAVFRIGYGYALLALTEDPNRQGIALGNPMPVPLGLPQEPTSRTMDLLLDVEMPVSISFGRAQLPLRDVLKLSSGSIVELNRAIVEPVEIIVNNCVIARGEVVVIEGNYGVKIQQIISRQERLRTLR